MGSLLSFSATKKQCVPFTSSIVVNCMSQLDFVYSQVSGDFHDEGGIELEIIAVATG